MQFVLKIPKFGSMNNKINEIRYKKIKYFLIDGIAGAGKTSFAYYLKKKLKKKNIIIFNKDIFLKNRNERISFTKKNQNKKIKMQNIIHYDLKKYNKILMAFKNKENKTITFKNLYNRKNGKNNLSYKFNFNINNIYIIEGLYVCSDFNFLNKKKTVSILIISDHYRCLIEKIRRIRDKKISIYLVIKEYLNIHLYSFLHYLNNIKFNFILNADKYLRKSNKRILSHQVELIKIFLDKHK